MTDLNKNNKLDKQRRFYNMIIHEIRTQVGIVSNLSEMLLDEDLAKSHEFYKISLKQTSDRIVQLSQDFLEIEQFNNHEITLRPETINLEKFMEIFATPYTHMAANKGLLLKLLVDENCPKYINVDAVRLGQILSNMVDNAIKYTDKGQVQIHVHYKPSNKISLSFDVIDTGIGINLNDDKVRAKIFTEYARFDNALGKKGVGLGLWIVKNLAQAMGGSIELEANHPQIKAGGTCFSLSLPANINPKVRLKNKKQPSKKTEPPTIDAPFLLVEDNKLNQHIIGTMLNSAGIDYDVAASILEAKYLIDLRQYSIILLDLNLPDGRGEDLLQQLPTQKIIALTADADDNLERKLKQLGFKGLINKPIIIKDFFRTIYAILS